MRHADGCVRISAEARRDWRREQEAETAATRHEAPRRSLGSGPSLRPEGSGALPGVGLSNGTAAIRGRANFPGLQTANRVRPRTPTNRRENAADRGPRITPSVIGQA